MLGFLHWTTLLQRLKFRLHPGKHDIRAGPTSSPITATASRVCPSAAETGLLESLRVVYGWLEIFSNMILRSGMKIAIAKFAVAISSSQFPSF
jgi:hypothetical protein